MLQAKKALFVKTALVIGLSAYIGLADKAWALEISLPSSIHDVLTSEQIDTVKADPRVQAIRNGMRGQVVTEQAIKRPAAQMVMSGALGDVRGNAITRNFQKEIGTSEEAAALDSTSPDVSRSK